MKTVISTHEKSLNSSMDKRFGRAHFFCIFDDSTNQTSFEDNPYFEAEGGAGSKTSELMIQWGIKKVISGHFGPKAKSVLEKFDIQMVEIEEDISVETLLNKIKNK
ncbi:MAG: NifB/NifX family molybdenum-iron cluster-binding protein [Prolixibacteraceae bacterium]